MAESDIQNFMRQDFVMTGSGTLDHDFNYLSQHDLKSGELRIGLPAALIILLLVFGAVVAGLVPLMITLPGSARLASASSTLAAARMPSGSRVTSRSSRNVIRVAVWTATLTSGRRASSRRARTAS